MEAQWDIAHETEQLLHEEKRSSFRKFWKQKTGRNCDWLDGRKRMKYLGYMHEEIKWFFEMKTTAGEDSVKIIEMTTGLRILHTFNWLRSDKVWRDDSNSERNSTVGKMLSNSIAYYRKSPPWKEGSITVTTFSLILRNCQNHPNFSNTTLIR